MKHLTAFRERLERTAHAPSIEIDNEHAALLICDIVESERILAMLNSPKCVTLEADRKYFVGNVIVSFRRETEVGTIGITAIIPFPPLWRRIAGVFNPKYLFPNT